MIRQRRPLPGQYERLWAILNTIRQRRPTHDDDCRPGIRGDCGRPSCERCRPPQEGYPFD